MRRLLLPVVLFLAVAGMTAHPLHLSVTNITFGDGTVKVVMNTFRDDWETAFFHYQGRLADFTDPSQRQEPWFESYLNESFRLSAGKEKPPVELVLGSVQLEDDAMKLELEGTFMETPNSLYIYNALLTDIFPDQTNLVIIGFNNRERGMKFDVKNLAAEIPIE